MVSFFPLWQKFKGIFLGYLAWKIWWRSWCKTQESVRTPLILPSSLECLSLNCTCMEPRQVQWKSFSKCWLQPPPPWASATIKLWFYRSTCLSNSIGNVCPVTLNLWRIKEEWLIFNFFSTFPLWGWDWQLSSSSCVGWKTTGSVLTFWAKRGCYITIALF